MGGSRIRVLEVVGRWQIWVSKDGGCGIAVSPGWAKFICRLSTSLLGGCSATPTRLSLSQDPRLGIFKTREDLEAGPSGQWGQEWNEGQMHKAFHSPSQAHLRQARSRSQPTSSAFLRPTFLRHTSTPQSLTTTVLDIIYTCAQTICQSSDSIQTSLPSRM